MKKILFLTMFLLSFNANGETLKLKSPDAPSSRKSEQCGSITPRTLPYVCGRFQTEQGTVDCIAAARGAYVSQCGLGVCDRYRTEGGTVRCIQALRNREFNEGILEVCDNLTTEEATTDCIASAGYRFGGGANSREIRDQVQSALYELEDGYYSEAKQTLRRLLRDLEQ